jgi:hypothetical protein
VTAGRQLRELADLQIRLARSGDPRRPSPQGFAAQPQVPRGRQDQKTVAPEDERLALLLENVDVDQDVRLGDPAVWRAAVAALPRPSRSLNSACRRP